jgi:hypothetical protein
VTSPSDSHGSNRSPLEAPRREDGWTPRGNANGLHLPSHDLLAGVDQACQLLRLVIGDGIGSPALPDGSGKVV